MDNTGLLITRLGTIYSEWGVVGEYPDKGTIRPFDSIRDWYSGLTSELIPVLLVEIEITPRFGIKNLIACARK